ncbi:methionyl tRNA synthetase [Thelephora ganbajun]|uniref:Methionyl tRNA synthetase n=1 Tax=Thelephora ganbajun TaxID=370292 RepID=A0ACB6ZJW3_THEGA|nr:methionyl tRNA synthetase [Thelephora ganbajun]
MTLNQNVRQAEGILRSVPDPGQIVLPKDGETNILITSALPYCNNVPHLGNIIGSTLSADVYSRYSRTRNRRTLYICGTDEYGTATETQALKEGITPKELCDKYNVIHAETYEWFELGFDYFGRTSSPEHIEICQEIYLNLQKNGYLERQEKEQTYCEGCQKFLADRFVEGICPHCGADDARGDQCDVCTRTFDAIELINPRCLVNKTHKVVTKISAHMYVSLDKLQDWTQEWIKQSYAAGKWSPNPVINTEGEIIDARMKSGLHPSPVTRDLTWGVPVPLLDGEDPYGMKGKVLYVWFDACIGYQSITASYTPEWKQWWQNPDNVRLYQFMGKDNVFFHIVYWPSLLRGDGRNWSRLHHLSTTEYLNYEGGKFSKSHGRGVFGPAAKETGIPASVWRYYLISTRPETQDSMFSWSDCITANNSVLLNNFGNFVNRALKFVAAVYDGTIPDSGDEPGPLSPNDVLDAEFVSDVNGLLKDYITAMDAVKLRSGLQIVMHVSARGNLYLQSSGLNKALKAENPKRCAQVVVRAVNLIYVLSALVYPFMPSTSESVLTQINAPARAVPEVLSIDILPGHQIGNPEHLFKKIDEKMIEVYKEKFAGNKPVPNGPDLDAVHAVPGASKKVKGKTPGPVQDTGPKTAEVLAWEEKVKTQGDVVRELKAKSTKSAEDQAEITKAVDELKKLKAELASYQRKAGTEATAVAN